MRRALVLIPGLMCDARLFAPQVAALSDAFRVIVPDVSQPADMRGMAEAVLAQAPPGPLAIAGLSMGGMIALAVLRHFPERVERLALLDTTHRADTPERAAERQGLIAQTRAGQFATVMREKIAPRYFSEGADHGPLFELANQMALDLGAQTFIRQTTAILTRPSSEAVLAGFSGPALVLCGRNERLLPVSLHEDMAQTAKNADLVVLAGASHLATLDRPDGVNAALRMWLAR